MPAFGRNQVATALVRRLAGRGYHVLQLDYPGRGDSPGSEPPDPIDEPAKLEVFAAARAAYGWLRSRGLSRVLTIGSCQGAVAALNTADAASSLSGIALLAPLIAERFEAQTAYGEPLGDVSPMHPRIRGSFEAVAEAGTPLLIAYGVHDEGFLSFEAAMDGDLGAILRCAGERLTLILTEERIHGYMTVSGQESTIDLVMAWMDRLHL
jgi:pimeloyl-ACP methyl ester carboxylesterase